MKILTSAQIHELDKYTIEHEPISSIDLMERAACALTHAITEEWDCDTPVVVFAGPGNNGGDALAVARMLAASDYEVEVYLFNVRSKLSNDCDTNRKKLLEQGKIRKFTEITLNFDPPKLTSKTLVVDGLFGSGINKPLAGGFASMVNYINQSPAKVVSLDIPSGLMCEDNTFNSCIIKADLTLTLQQKKLSMFFAESQSYIGRLKVLDIQLSHEYANEAASSYTIIERDEIRSFLRQRDDFAHKGSMGNAFLIAGSYGMAGAAIFASKACFRSGVGKLTVGIPKRNYDIMQTSIPEAVLQIDQDENYFSAAINADNFDAMGIGPGIGQQENTALAMISQIQRTKCPIVLDADALNILANHRTWLRQLPKGLIMTPHPKEFDRISGNMSNSAFVRLQKAREMAKKMQSFIILKGHYSALCIPDGNVVFNSTGNSGMATAGCGDVLTGILTGLLARGYNKKEACLLGMYLHGLAGDLAVKEIGKESLMASDIIQFISKAIINLETE